MTYKKPSAYKGSAMELTSYGGVHLEQGLELKNKCKKVEKDPKMGGDLKCSSLYII